MCVCVCVCYVGENKKEREIREKEKMSADCGRLLSIFKHAATQVSVQASPNHSPHRPHDMLNVCICIWYDMHYIVRQFRCFS